MQPEVSQAQVSGTDHRNRMGLGQTATREKGGCIGRVMLWRFDDTTTSTLSPPFTLILSLR